MTTMQSLAVCAAIGVALSAQSPAVVMALLAETRADGPLSRRSSSRPSSSLTSP